ncbi:MAG TPA: hypothetical protein VJ063_17070 [Verrucomicrobiae bacterium]|nr:hypothetical protein [Verrucomicrobiae bacterium]
MSKSICLLALLLLAGCDTIDRTQFRVEPRTTASGTRVAINAADIDMVKAVIQPFAADFKMRDISQLSLIPNALATYQQYDTTTPMKLVAWTQEGAIIIDLAHDSPEPGESPGYVKAREQLLADLRRQFGNRVTVVPYRREAEQRQKLGPERSVTVTPSR